MTEVEAREAAHGPLIAAGFDLKYTSPSGSRYYHLSGRRVVGRYQNRDWERRNFIRTPSTDRNPGTRQIESR